MLFRKKISKRLRREKIPAKIKTAAVVLYFNELSFRKTAQVLKQTMGIEVGLEAVRV